jgi:hypothetical protein
LAARILFPYVGDGLELTSNDAEVLAGRLKPLGTRPAIAIRDKLLAAIAADTEAEIVLLGAMEMMAIREALGDIDLADAPTLETLRFTLANPPAPRPPRAASDIFVVQIASFGGPKFGLEEEAEGAWIDHNVHFRGTDADDEARIIETAEFVDKSDALVDGMVMTARVVSMEEIESEFGVERVHRIMAMFSDRLSELWKQE